MKKQQNNHIESKWNQLKPPEGESIRIANSLQFDLEQRWHSNQSNDANIWTEYRCANCVNFRILWVVTHWSALAEIACHPGNIWYTISN